MTRIPPEAAKAAAIIRQCLPKSPAAVYLHGSAVSGGLRPRSDVDLLAVIDKEMTPESRKSLAAGLMAISGRYPFDPAGRRPLELIVFSRADMAAALYPARSEFVYGEWLRQAYEAGGIPGPACDPEFTLVLAQAGREAMPLFGPDARELLPLVPQEDIRRAIADALPALLAAQEGDERNVLLTLARMWRTLVSGEFYPKDVAAAWAAGRLPDAQAAVLIAARAAYLGLRENERNGQRPEVRNTIRALRDCVTAELGNGDHHG